MSQLPINASEQEQLLFHLDQAIDELALARELHVLNQPAVARIDAARNDLIALVKEGVQQRIDLPTTDSSEEVDPHGKENQ